MTKKDIDDIIGIICPNDDDFEKACISPAYLKKELESLALEQEPCEDCISRQAVIDGINRYFHDEYYQRTSIQDCMDCLIEDVIKPLPPVTPKPKMGRWIALENRFELGDRLKCSECDQVFVVGDDVSRNYCPNCGAKMEESEGTE